MSCYRYLIYLMPSLQGNAEQTGSLAWDRLLQSNIEHFDDLHFKHGPDDIS